MTRSLACALALAALTLGLGGCSRHAPRVAAPTSARAPVDRFAEVDVAQLPKGRFPVRTTEAPGTTFSRSIQGIYIDPAPGPPRISGLKNSEDTFAAEVRDQPESEAAYCLAYASGSGVEEDSIGLLTQRALPIVADEFGVRAERIVDGADGRLRFELLRGRVSESRGFGVQGAGSAPLRRLAAYEGVEVFAFVDDSLERTKPSVDFVIRRPPLNRRSVRYAAFVALLPDGRGAAASCSHIRIALPVELGDAAAASVDVGVETDDGARRLRVQLGTLWLPGAPSAKATARLDWYGPEVENLPLPDPPVQTDETIQVRTISKRRRSR